MKKLSPIIDGDKFEDVHFYQRSSQHFYDKSREHREKGNRVDALFYQREAGDFAARAREGMACFLSQEA
ncbi:hypothetical protein [Roseibium sp. RKSG952]|uniref:hypothetical protein n=1 Tax=Roseibium sp. RKSG952 TaxID=2529384 RepID=UPI0012BCB5E9|nr:hypothetical protein [Roseibium sp. RKSG952]MTH94695.1 hypothetical protein [Roseibium sp. RKSG952]